MHEISFHRKCPDATVCLCEGMIHSPDHSGQIRTDSQFSHFGSDKLKKTNIFRSDSEIISIGRLKKINSCDTVNLKIFQINEFLLYTGTKHEASSAPGSFKYFYVEMNIFVHLKMAANKFSSL